MAVMVEKQRLEYVGRKIATARQRLGVSQAELGCLVWPELSNTAAQTRIYRIEHGRYELNYQVAHRVFELLAIYDIDANTLEDIDDHEVLCFNKSILLRYPELRHYVPLINAAAINNRFEEVRRLVAAMAAAFTHESQPNRLDRHEKGIPDPFRKRGKPKS